MGCIDLTSANLPCVEISNRGGAFCIFIQIAAGALVVILPAVNGAGCCLAPLLGNAGMRSNGGQSLQSGCNLALGEVGVTHITEVVGSNSVLQLGLGVNCNLSRNQITVVVRNGKGYIERMGDNISTTDSDCRSIGTSRKAGLGGYSEGIATSLCDACLERIIHATQSKAVCVGAGEGHVQRASSGVTIVGHSNGQSRQVALLITCNFTTKGVSAGLVQDNAERGNEVRRNLLCLDVLAVLFNVIHGKQIACTARIMSPGVAHKQHTAISCIVCNNDAMSNVYTIFLQLVNNNCVLINAIFACKLLHNAGQIRINIAKAVHIEIGTYLGQRPCAVVCIHVIAVCVQRIVVAALSCFNYLILRGVTYISLHVISKVKSSFLQTRNILIGCHCGHVASRHGEGSSCGGCGAAGEGQSFNTGPLLELLASLGGIGNDSDRCALGIVATAGTIIHSHDVGDGGKVCHILGSSIYGGPVSRIGADHLPILRPIDENITVIGRCGQGEFKAHVVVTGAGADSTALCGVGGDGDPGSFNETCCVRNSLIVTRDRYRDFSIIPIDYIVA